MASINIRMRFTDKELAHGIDGLLKKGHPVPDTLQEIIRQIVYFGNAYSHNDANYDQTSPSISSQNIINQINQTRSHKRNLPHLTQQLHNDLNTVSTINTVDFTKSVESTNSYLLQHLDPADKAKGQNMLSMMDIPGGANIKENLTSENEEVRRITYTMFRHSEHLTEEEQILIDNYKENSNEK